MTCSLNTDPTLNDREICIQVLEINFAADVFSRITRGYVRFKVMGNEVLFGDLLNLSTMSLATSNPDGKSFVAPIFFVGAPPAGEENSLFKRLYFFSEEKSQHSQNLKSNPEVAVAIYPQCSGWQEIRGIQMRGNAFLVNSQNEWEYAWRSYQKKFPFVSEMEHLIAQNRMYVFVPVWVRNIDNRNGFDSKQEWDLEAIS